MPYVLVEAPRWFVVHVGPLSIQSKVNIYHVVFIHLLKEFV